MTKMRIHSRRADKHLNPLELSVMLNTDVSLSGLIGDGGCRMKVRPSGARLVAGFQRVSSALGQSDGARMLFPWRTPCNRFTATTQ